jgi:hypothetical protein
MFEIEDSYEGIAPKVLLNIFEPFSPLNLLELELLSVCQSQIILLRITTAASNVNYSLQKGHLIQGYFTAER